MCVCSALNLKCHHDAAEFACTPLLHEHTSKKMFSFLAWFQSKFKFTQTLLLTRFVVHSSTALFSVKWNFCQSEKSTLLLVLELLGQWVQDIRTWSNPQQGQGRWSPVWLRRQRRRMPGSCSRRTLLLGLTILLIDQPPVSGWIAGSSNAAAYWNM